MKNNKKELDVDFIGGEEPLTPEEEKAISDFIRRRLHLGSKKNILQTKRKKRTKVSA